LQNGDDENVSGLAPGETCVVCLYSKATAVYKECGHLVCCEVCAARMSKCPLCRKQGGWMKVYRAGG
jgi:E3 ubiquitin-protein ligase MUL1